jgi:hypothetical protein
MTDSRFMDNRMENQSTDTNELYSDPFCSASGLPVLSEIVVRTRDLC